MARQKRLFEGRRKKLTEDRSPNVVGKDNVDLEAGIIRKCRLLGNSSKNLRKYSPKAMRQAAQFYEGCAVRIDHKPDEMSRPMIDDVGEIRDVVVLDANGTEIPLEDIDESGVSPESIWGDFHYLKEHPFAKLVAEKATRMPQHLGFSHDADGIVEDGTDGIEHVVEMLGVNSLDLVTKPATNKNLFEEEEPKMRKMTILAALMSTPKGTAGRSRLLESMDDSTSATEIEIAENAPAEEVVATALDAAVDAVVNGEGSAEEKMDALAEMAGADGEAGEGMAKLKEMLESTEETDPVKVLEAIYEMAGVDMPDALKPDNVTEEEGSEGGAETVQEEEGGEATPAMKAVQESLKRMEQRLERSEKLLEAEQKKTEKLREQQNSESQARALLESAGVDKPTTDEVQMVMNAGSKQARTRLVESIVLDHNGPEQDEPIFSNASTGGAAKGGYNSDDMRSVLRS